MAAFWFMILGILIGLLMAAAGHSFAWWLRFHFRPGTVFLGCLGAAVFTWFCSLFMGPYTGEASSYAWAALGAVWALALLLGIWQVWLLAMPLILTMTGLFVDVLVSMIFLFLFTWSRIYLLKSVSFQTGRLLFDNAPGSLDVMQRSLLGALMAGLLFLELAHPFIRKLKPFRTSPITLLLASFLLLLSACGRTNLPGFTPSPVITIQPAPGSTLLPEITETRMPVPTPENTCRYLPESDTGDAVMPEPGSIRWETVSPGLSRLDQFNAGIYAIDTSPDGRWLAAELVQKMGDMGDADTLLYVLDSQADSHWIAGSHSRLGWYHRSAWQPDGRLVWVDQGQVWRANGDGKNRENLDASSPMDEVWAGANGALVASGMGLWQWLPDGRGWTKIDLAPSVSQPSANLSITPDGLFAAIFSNGSLWKAPVTARGPAKFLNRIEYSGTEGRVGAPQALRYNPLWIIPVPVTENGPESYALINSENGDIVPVAEAFPGTLPGYSWPTTSPGGKWVLVEVKTGLKKSADGVYIAPAMDLNTGETYKGSFTIQGWYQNGSAVLLLQTLAEQERLVVLSLSRNSSPMEIASFRSTSQISIAMTEAGFVLSLSENPLEKGGHRLLAYNRDGKLTSEKDLPTPLNSYAVLTPGKANMVFARTINAQGGGDEPCVFTKTLYKWNIDMRQ
ncbi:MAG: hypothetical protein ACM3PY_17590 [Omnitrophica WOR_2 bacterium]